jgi:hypothetical protein
MAYVKLNVGQQAGKGFITHLDKKLLDFEGFGDIYKVTGNSDNIALWADRVGVSLIPDADAQNMIREMKSNGIDSRIESLKAEISDLKKIKTSLG